MGASHWEGLTGEGDEMFSVPENALCLGGYSRNLMEEPTKIRAFQCVSYILKKNFPCEIG